VHSLCYLANRYSTRYISKQVKATFCTISLAEIYSVNLLVSELEHLKETLQKVTAGMQHAQSIEVTRALTQAVCNWAELNGWHTSCEHPIAVRGYVSQRGHRRVSGRIDVWIEKHPLASKSSTTLPRSKIASENYRPEKIAIEIDRANKKWSLAKLVQAEKNGACPIWIRWGGHRVIPVPKFINLIDLTTTLHWRSVMEHKSGQTTSYVTIKFKEKTESSGGSKILVRGGQLEMPASSCRQDPKSTILIDSNGEIVFSIPTELIASVKWQHSEKQSKNKPPAAGTPWKADEDELLCSGFENGHSIKDLASTHGRTHGAIRSRLMRLGLIDYR
jgi:hypothetical protein